MDIEQQLRTALAPCRPGQELRARILARVSQRGSAARTGHARSRSILFGTILVVAAVAAMMSIYMMDSHDPQLAAVTETAPATVVDRGIEPAARPASIAVEPTPPVVPSQPSQSFTVRVPPVTTVGDDVAGNAVAQRFRERVVAGLYTVPHLVLLDPESDEALIADYEVRIKYSGQSSALYRSVEIDAGNSSQMAAADAMDRLPPLQQQRARAERALAARPAGRSPNMTLLLGLGFPRTVIIEDNGPIQPPGADRTAYAVDKVVKDLRAMVFRPDPLLQQDLLARLRDPAVRPNQRVLAFGDLLKMAASRGGLATVDAEAVRAAGELALSAPDKRVRELAWEGLQATGHSAMVPYLARGLDSEPEPSIRLHLVRILASDFSDDAEARAALEAASGGNELQVVQMAAMRELQGESKWNDYVTRSLHDAQLTDLQRLQPIADMLPPDRAALAAGTAKVSIQLDEESIRELGSLLIRAARDPDSGAAPGNALQVLGTLEAPAVRDVLIDVLLPSDGEPQTGLQGVSVMGLKSTAMLLSTSRYWDDPLVRAALEKIADRPDLLYSFMAREQLSAMDMKATFETILRQSQPQ